MTDYLFVLKAFLSEPFGFLSDHNLSELYVMQNYTLKSVMVLGHISLYIYVLYM